MPLFSCSQSRCQQRPFSLAILSWLCWHSNWEEGRVFPLSHYPDSSCPLGFLNLITSHTASLLLNRSLGEIPVVAKRVLFLLKPEVRTSSLQCPPAPRRPALRTRLLLTPADRAQACHWTSPGPWKPLTWHWFFTALQRVALVPFLWMH